MDEVPHEQVSFENDQKHVQVQVELLVACQNWVDQIDQQYCGQHQFSSH
jgi:hypothetical protein